MRVLIQQADTGLYYKDARTWVASEREARQFHSSIEAIDFCHRQQIGGGVVILLRFNGAQHDIRLHPFDPPIVPGSGSGASG